jgi:flagellar hook-length control protein FliK
MSQAVSNSDLSNVLGLSGSGGGQATLQQMLDTLDAEGKTFADLLDSEFAQFLDPEILDENLKLEDLDPEAKDSLLPLLALLGGNSLPLEGQDLKEMKGEIRDILSQAEGGKQSLQQILKSLEGKLPDQMPDSGGDLLLLNTKADDDAKDISEAFLKQLQLSASNFQQAASPATQSAIQPGTLQPAQAQLLQQPANLPPVHVAQTVQTPPGEPGWDAQVGQRLMWMVNNEIKSAEIKLNPAELGPMEVKVRTEGDKVQVSFHVHNAPVRDAIEQSIPRLREAFTGQGMDLLNVNVSQQGFSQQGQQSAQGESTSAFANSGMDGLEADESVQTTIVSGNGLVDYYI